MAGFYDGVLVLDENAITTSSGDNNDVVIKGSLTYVIVSNNNDAITGIVPPNTGVGAGILAAIVNVGPTNDLIIKHNSGSSSAGNKIKTATGYDLVVHKYEMVFIGYDSANTEWHALKIALEPVMGFMYFNGDENTDGAWRQGVVGGDFVRQKRISGVWTTLGSDTE